MKILSTRDYARLRYWRSFAWTMFGLAWMWAWCMTFMWQSERATSKQLRRNLATVVELQTTWRVE